MGLWVNNLYVAQVIYSAALLNRHNVMQIKSHPSI